MQCKGGHLAAQELVLTQIRANVFVSETKFLDLTFTSLLNNINKTKIISRRSTKVMLTEKDIFTDVFIYPTLSVSLQS